MLKKQQRLTKNQFDEYFKTGRQSHSPALQLIYTKSDDFHGAVVVGKKVFKSAVKRNRLRRQLYNALYRYHQTNNLRGVFVVIAKPSAKNLTNKQIVPSLLSLLEKVKY